MWLAKARLAGSVWIAQVKPNTDSNGRFSSRCPTNKLASATPAVIRPPARIISTPLV